MRSILILLACTFAILPAQAQFPIEAQGKLLVYALLYTWTDGHQTIDLRIANYTKQSWVNIVVECDFRRGDRSIIATRKHTFKGPVFDFQYQLEFKGIAVNLTESARDLGCAVASAERGPNTLIPAR